MAEKKPKYDLSNVGGKPKDWLDRSGETGQDEWWQDVKMVSTVIGIGLLLLGSIGAIAYVLLDLRA